MGKRDGAAMSERLATPLAGHSALAVIGIGACPFERSAGPPGCEPFRRDAEISRANAGSARSDAVESPFYRPAGRVHIRSEAALRP
jgi:hypothetical protein